MANRKKIFYVLCLLACCMHSYSIGVAAKSKKAIVIGASSGMGREVAKLLSQEGYTVGLAARRMALLESLQAELPNQSYIKQLDVMESNAREQLQLLIEQMGGCDLMVISISPSSEIQSNEWAERKKILEVVAVSFIAMADVALEYFKKQNSGHLVGISSTAGIRGESRNPEYSGAKACIMTYMEGVRNYVIQNNINVYITDIRPAYVAVEYSPLGSDPNAYWEITCEQAGQEIIAAIKARQKIALIPASYWGYALLLNYLPDWLYNRYFFWS